MITAEDLGKLLAEHEQDIKDSVIDEVKAQIKCDLEWSLRQEISAIVKTFLTEDIAPEIRSALAENKPVILAAVVEAANTMGALLTEGLVSEVKERMETSYRRQNIVKALFQ
jgi:hypothetical protein